MGLGMSRGYNVACKDILGYLMAILDIHMTLCEGKDVTLVGPL